MIEFDMAKAGATTILSCGTTNAGHYTIVQQSFNSWVGHEESKNIYEILEKLAPVTPSKDWKLYEVNLIDHKSDGKFYSIIAEYKFLKGREKYSNEVNITPQQTEDVYKIFESAVKDQRR